jgi:hypothetical protein
MSVDIVVSFDTTGSMRPCSVEVTRKVTEFINTLFNEVSDLRMGLIAHGDYCDYPRHITKRDLTSNRAALISFMQSVQQTGGGDADECYEYVLNQALSFDWQADNKALVMIGDADPHRVGYPIIHANLQAAREISQSSVYDWKHESQTLIAHGIKIYSVQALHNARTRFWNELADIGRTPKLDLHQFTNIVPLLTAITYKQQSDEKVQQYGQQLQDAGQLDRGLATALNLLLNAKNLVGGLDFSSEKTDLEAVDPWRFQVLHVDHNVPINEFVRSTGATFRTGKGFYELTKPETVQENKEVVLRDSKGDFFSGHKAREMIGVPFGVRGRVQPNHDLGYTVFIQSTSANRKLIGGTRFLYEVE